MLPWRSQVTVPCCTLCSALSLQQAMVGCPKSVAARVGCPKSVAARVPPEPGYPLPCFTCSQQYSPHMGMGTHTAPPPSTLPVRH